MAGLTGPGRVTTVGASNIDFKRNNGFCRLWMEWTHADRKCDQHFLNTLTIVTFIFRWDDWQTDPNLQPNTPSRHHQRVDWDHLWSRCLGIRQGLSPRLVEVCDDTALVLGGGLDLLTPDKNPHSLYMIPIHNIQIWNVTNQLCFISCWTDPYIRSTYVFSSFQNTVDLM